MEYSKPACLKTCSCKQAGVSDTNQEAEMPLSCIKWLIYLNLSGCSPAVNMHYSSWEFYFLEKYLVILVRSFILISSSLPW